MLTRFTTTHFNNSGKAVQIAKEGAKATGTDADRVSASKKLLKCDELDACISYAAASRAWNRSVTSPWWDNGTRVLSATTYQAYASEALIRREHYTQVLLPAFVAVYPDVRRDARYILGAEFNQSDYPSEHEIGDLFVMGFNVIPWPSASNFDVRTGLSASDVDAIRQQIAASERATIDLARKDVLDRVREELGHLIGRMETYKPAGAPGTKSEGVFRDGLIDGVRKLVEILPRLDFTGQWNLDELAARIEREVCQNSVGALRADAGLRESTQQAAERLLREMSAYV
jgi:hypothetical protein